MKPFAAALAIAAVLVATSCTQSGTASTAPTTPAPSITSTTTASTTSATSAPAPATPAAPVTHPAYPAPEGVVPGSPAAVAWESLMGPAGEYHALASYQAVIDNFGQVQPYVSIQRAEQNHVDALTRQLERFGVAVPDNPYLGQIPAPPDLKTAAAAWAEGERANVAMYDQLLPRVAGDVGMTRVMTNLRRASLEVHLPAFEKAAQGDGTLTAEQMAELGMH